MNTNTKQNDQNNVESLFEIKVNMITLGFESYIVEDTEYLKVGLTFFLKTLKDDHKELFDRLPILYKHIKEAE